MAIEYLAGNRLRGTSAERLALAVIGVRLADSGISKDNLKAYWKFNETSGDIINQAATVGSTHSLGSGADLDVTGASYNQTNTPFNTMNFDGSNDYVQAGTSLSQFNFLHNGGKWTIACWMEIGDISIEGTVFGNTDGANTHGINILQNGSNNQAFLFRVFDSGIWINANMGDHGLTNGNPFFVTFTFDPTESTDKATFYRDGVEIATANQSASQGSSSNSPIAFRIARSSGSVYFEVNVSEYSIWNRVLTDAEISSLYQGAPNIQDGAVYYETDTNKSYVLYDGSWSEL